MVKIMDFHLKVGQIWGEKCFKGGGYGWLFFENLKIFARLAQFYIRDRYEGVRPLLQTLK